MTLRRISAMMLGALLVLGLLAFAQIKSARAEVYSDSAYSDQEVVGLAIDYKPGIVPIDIFGNQAAIDLAGGKLQKGVAVGDGIWTATFAHPVGETEAKQIAELLTNDYRIEAVYLDHFLTNAKLALATPKLAVLKPSTAPYGLVASDAWSSTTASKAKIKLVWKAPTKLNGGLLWGYRISKYNSATGTYITLVDNSKSKNTTVTVASGLVAGATEKFKVAAVTKTADSKYMAVSPYSSIVSIVPTAAPKSPVLQTAGNITSAAPTVTWATQTKIEKGGLSVNYTVNAVSADNFTASCTTTSNSCVLSGMLAGQKYSVRVTATNSRGSSTSAVVADATDPMISQQWYLDSAYGINAVGAWNITKGSPDIVVAVVDTGITSHPDLNDNLVTGYDFISSPSNARDGNGRDADPTDPGDYDLSNNTSSSWHGTHVAGIIAAESNSIGITGIAPNVKLSPVRVLGINGGSESDIAAGINWAIGVPVSGVPTNMHPAKVVNLSIGSSGISTCYSKSLTQLAIDNAKIKDATLVTAAGNNNTYASESYPGNCWGNITIGATGYYGDRAFYSNFAGYYPSQDVFIGVDISAPGGDDRIGSGLPAGGQIWSTLNDGKTTEGNPTYGAAEGTSMASPMAAGIVALMYSVRPSLTDDEVWKILSTTTKKFASTSDCADQIIETQLNDGSIVKSGLCGIGIIDAGAAVAAALKLNK